MRIVDKMGIERVYLSHTQYCSGWDLDKIIEDTIFEKSITTHRHTISPDEKPPKMLDWDFKNPDYITHLKLAKKYDLEVVMAPDIWNEKEVERILNYVEKLQKFCPRVVIPVHYYDERLEDYELAYPMPAKFNPESGKNLPPLWKWNDKVTHLLGGSPQKQFERMKYFPNVSTLDGNLIFWCAVQFGEYWEDGKWVKPEPRLTNKECFIRSVENLNSCLQN